MASSSFDNAADDFTELKKAIENLVNNKLPRAQKENRKLVLNDISRRLDATEVALKEMQREVDKASAGLRPQLSYKFRAYQSEYNNLTRQIEAAKQISGASNDYNQIDSTSKVIDDADSRLESNSIWNSAGLTTEFNPNLPSSNPLQHYQNFSQLNSFPSISVSNEQQMSSRFSFGQQAWKEPENPPTVPSFLSQFSDEPFGSPVTSSASSSNVLSPNNSAISPLSVPEGATANPPSVSPTPTTNKDPGYFSESECSSNSSEKDNLPASFSKSLHIDPYSPLANAPIAVPSKSPVSSKPSLESISTVSDSSPTVTNVFGEEVLNVLSQYDPQSFDTQEYQLTGDESWKVIKKPGKEAEIVPDLSSPESIANVPSEGSWSGASSPSIGSTWSAETNKPSFVQSTKQQVCVFCRNNGEDASVYTTHTLMSTAGKVICPILYAYKCPICQATGDYAHTLKYCPMMPKGVNTGNQPAQAQAASSRMSNLARLPKTATFPKHLSSNAKVAMSMGPMTTKPIFQPTRTNRFGKSTTGYPNTNPGNTDLSTIADLREAAQKILMFTNQVMQNQPQGQGNQANPRNPPQVAQFLLKLDNNKPSASPTSGNNESFTRNFMPPQNTPSTVNKDGELAKILELLTANPMQGQGYQPFNNPPPQFGTQEADNGAMAKLQELLSANNSGFPRNMGNDMSKFMMPPTSLPPTSLGLKTRSTSSPASPFSPSFNVSAQPFVPNFDAGSSESGQSVNDSASAEIFKMLGINKAGDVGDDVIENYPTPEPNKENSLANILANIKEHHSLNNG